MANDLLLVTLKETRDETVCRRDRCFERLQEASTACDDARFGLRQAQQQERDAVPAE